MKNMSVSEAKIKLDNNEITLIDVREPYEYEEAAIEGSHLIPLGEMTEEKLPTLQGPIVIHCRSGKRSAHACQLLELENSNLDLYNLEGGILAWSEAGFPTRKGTK